MYLKEKYKERNPGADQGFFLAEVHIFVFSIFAEYQLYKKVTQSSQGGEVVHIPFTLPLDPPLNP